MTLPLLVDQDDKEYKTLYATQAYKLAMLGWSHKQIAEFFDITIDKFDWWRKTHDDFGDAIRNGGALADAEVVISLHMKAKGYMKPVTKAHYDDFLHEWKTVEYFEHVEPDVKAIMMWVTPRQKGNTFGSMLGGSQDSPNYSAMVSDNQPNTEKAVQAWHKMIGK